MMNIRKQGYSRLVAIHPITATKDIGSQGHGLVRAEVVMIYRKQLQTLERHARHSPFPAHARADRSEQLWLGDFGAG
jgi:hypothetical protein